MKFYTADRTTGTQIDCFITYADALSAIDEYEEEDRENGTYEPDFYQVIAENHRSFETSLVSDSTGIYEIVAVDAGGVDLKEVMYDDYGNANGYGDNRRLTWREFEKMYWF